MIKKIKCLLLFPTVTMVISPFYILYAQNHSISPEPILELEFDQSILDLSWNFDSTLLVIVNGDDTVSILDVETGGVVTKIENGLTNIENGIGVIQAAEWNPTRNHLLIASNRTRIWNQMTNEWEDDFGFPNALEFGFQNYIPAGNVDWHPDGERFAVVLRECDEGSPGRPGRRVETWNVMDATFFQIEECVDNTGIAKWNPQGTRIAISSFEVSRLLDEVGVWDLDTGERILTISDLTDPYDLAWSPQGEMIAFTTVIGINQFMQVRDVTDGEIVSQTEVNLAVYAPLDWHPSENLIATGGQDGSVRIWDALRGLELIDLPVHEDTVNDVSWSPDGDLLVSVGRDGRLFVWSTFTLLEQGM